MNILEKDLKSTTTILLPKDNTSANITEPEIESKKLLLKKNDKYKKNKDYFIKQARIHSIKKNYNCNEKLAVNYASLLDKIKEIKKNKEEPNHELIVEREKLKEKLRKLRIKNLK
jgi:hypothetical protein